MEIESMGAHVEVVVADVSDRTQMQRAFDHAATKFGTINGVIHAAGIVQAELIQSKTRQSAEAVLAPKVTGTMILLELLKPIKPDFVVLLSSVSSVLTPYGLCDYTAASTFLDAFAQFANGNKYFSALSINWSSWKEVGMLAELASLQGVEGRDEAAILNAITTKDGLAAFQRVFDSNLTHVIISPDDLDKQLHKASADGVLRRVRAQPEGPDLPTNTVEAALTDIWCNVFGLDEIGIHEQFSDLGGHSLLAMQIVARVRSLYQVTFNLRDFFESPTIAQMSSLIHARILEDIEGLSDEQARQQISDHQMS
jgi:acyl carrier protein